VTLEEASGISSEAGQAPSEGEQKQFLMAIKEEEDGEANLMELDYLSWNPVGDCLE
ncbi:UNVERIFIED_CONTAM: hypothetical protein K2H54_062361, partial [Gekko kuhli]